MERITFVIPSRNNLEFLQLAYESIRRLNTRHEILVLNDASTDGTQEWIDSLGDKDLIVHHNPGPERIGIVGMFDKGIEMARTDIIFAFHADMVACADLDKNILKHLKPGTVVSATRVEPPLHPAGPEKITDNFGIEVEEFDFKEWYDRSDTLKQDKVTEGIFAPWCMYKKDFLAIGGHDKLFAPQSKEDSDLFNRFVLNGYKVLQSWDALVYHFTSRGSRFNKHSGGAAGKNSAEWLHTTNKNARNFIRKWGHFVKHDNLMKPIIPPKYDIGIHIKNTTEPLLEVLEPWCTSMYTDMDFTDYVERVQPDTMYNIMNKMYSTTDDITNDVVIHIDGQRFGNNEMYYVQEISSIIADNGEVGEFELGNLRIEIRDMRTWENELIVCRK